MGEVEVFRSEVFGIEVLMGRYGLGYQECVWATEKLLLLRLYEISWEEVHGLLNDVHYARVDPGAASPVRRAQIKS